MASLAGELLSSRAEMHAAQDGVLVAILLWLPVISMQAATVLYSVLGLTMALSNGSVKLKKFVKVIDERIRTKEIRQNPEYFAIPFTAVSLILLGPAYFFGLISSLPF